MASRQHSVGNEPSHVHKQVCALLGSYDMASSADLVLGLAGWYYAPLAAQNAVCVAPKGPARSPLLCCQRLPLP